MTDCSSKSLAGRLTARAIDPSVIPHAMRYFVSADANDLPSEEMRTRLVDACGSSAIDAAIDRLQRDPDALEQASLAILSNGWGDPSTRELASGAIDAASTKLPVVELGLICLVGVYGLWIAATGGRRSEHTVIHHEADGSWSEETTTTWHGAGEPLDAIVRILTAGTAVLDSPETEPPAIP